MANSVTTVREMSEYFVEPPDGRLVDTLVSRGLTAQREIEMWSETRIDALLRGLANAVADRAEPLAAAAVAETGMGNVRDKTVKNSIASVGIYTELVGQVGYGEVCRDDERQVAEIASPVGLVVGLLPAAHPVATFIFKTLIDCVEGTQRDHPVSERARPARFRPRGRADPGRPSPGRCADRPGAVAGNWRRPRNGGRADRS
jgi:hypothetical protein